jgi:translation initiation factor IF-2
MSSAIIKRKIFHIAKELNISHNDILEFLANESIAVSGLMAEVDTDIYEKIINEFSKERDQLDRYRKDQARKAAVDTQRKTDKLQNPTSVEEKKVKTKYTKKTVDSDSALTQIQKQKILLEEKRAAEKLQKEEEQKLITLKEEKKVDTKEVKAEKAGSRKLKIVSRPEVPVKDPVKDDVKVDKTEIIVPVKTEKVKTSGLRIIRRATEQEKQKLIESKEKKLDLKKLKKDKAKSKDKPTIVKKDKKKPDISKLKKVSMSDIADKITKTKKVKASSAKVKGASQPLPQFGKKPKSKKPKKISSDKSIDSLDSDVKTIKVVEFTTADELAQAMDVQAIDVIKVCLNMGLMITINQRLDMESIILIADEFGFDVETAVDIAEEADRIIDSPEDIKNATSRPPVVTVMGHVDHGKTSLLDHIRDENVVAGEAGGITQHIGAYEVVLKSGEKITFLDTPGHAAFTAMRARGAQATDIVIVIIAAEDDVMPQTIEALDHAKAASVPIIIAINKIDKPQADPEKIKRQLSERNILVEDWGGKYQCAEISAKSGVGIDDLIEKVLLESEVLNLKANKDTFASGVVIESRLDKGLGAVATVLIQKGTINKGDIFVCGTQSSRVRAMMNERNVRIKKAFPSDPVQVLGFSEVPKAGDTFIVYDDEREAKKIATQRSQLKREADQRRFKHLTLDQIGKQIAEGQVNNLDIVIKGDVDGSIEALSDSLMGMSNKEVAVNIIHRSVGMITEADISLASASNAIVIAFNVKPTPEAKVLAKADSVEIRNYSVIYDAVNEVKLALEGLLRPEEIEEALGIAEVRAKIKLGRKDIIAGSYIRSGKAIRDALLRVERNGKVIHEGKLTSLKRFKDDVKEVKEGFECGIGVQGFTDFEVEDMIKFYEIKEVKRKLL